jgi:hypothetical protein
VAAAITARDKVESLCARMVLSLVEMLADRVLGSLRLGAWQRGAGPVELIFLFVTRHPAMRFSSIKSVFIISSSD